MEGAMKRYSIFLLMIFPFINGKLVFRPPIHEARIYENAPPGVHVTTVHAYDPDDPRKPVSYVLSDIRDHKYFAIEVSGNLTTAKTIDKKAGETYQVIVSAHSNEGDTELNEIAILVTKFNQFSPQFEQAKYHGEVHINTSIGTSVLHVLAHDNDSVSQNAEVYYRMDQNISNIYFQLNEHTGELSLLRLLNEAPRKLVFSVFAEDGGSPKRWAQAQIELLVKTISEPWNISVFNITESSAKVCWFRPVFGMVQGYTIKYYRVNIGIDNALVKNVSISMPIICTDLNYLEQWKDYILIINGRNDNETGQASREKRFSTRPDMCEKNICKNGNCIKIAEDPGYFCNCSYGYSGEICDIFDVCSSNPCNNQGKCRNTSYNSFNCECVSGFSGETCSNFNPCVNYTFPCRNGATCEVLPNNSYRCHCAKGYAGVECEQVDPCSSSPCLNEATCHNSKAMGYKCECVEGYSGKNCELNIDECASSPCQHGGSCKDSINRFTCHCPPGYFGEYCHLEEQCQEETLETDKGTFHWNDTKHSNVIVIRCPYGTIYSKDKNTEGYAKRSCLLFSNGSVGWNEMDTENCQAQGFKAAEELAEELNALTKDPSKVSPKDFQQAANQIEAIVQYAIYDQKLAYDMVSVISNMLAVNEKVYEEGDENGVVTKRLVQVVDTFASKVILKTGEKIDFFTPNIALRAIALNHTSSYLSGRMSFSPSPNQNRRKRDYSGDRLSLNNDSQLSKILLSSEVLDLAKQKVVEDNIRIKFVSYMNDKFFRSRKQTNICHDVDNKKVCQELKSFPDRQILQASVNNVSIVNLTEPVIYIIPTNNKQKYVCVYWDEYERQWSSSGVMTNQTANKTLCLSSHLTAFSVLLDPTPYLITPKQHQQILSVISYIGCGLSLTGLILTILTYSLFRCLNRDHSGKILLNLCISLSLMNAAFLLSSQQSSSKSGLGVCLTVAILTHYFLLTSLAWMCVEAVNMYQLLIHVFASAETHFLLKRFILAWGGPFIVVSIAAGVDINQYSTHNDYCMLSPSNPYIYYISFLGLSCLILLANLIVFIMVTKVLFTPRMTTNTHTNTVTAAQVRGAFTVMVLLGVTWIFGAFAVGEAKLVFQYLFCIANSLQGFLIFIVRCLQYHEARNAWLQLFQTGTLKKYRGVLPPGGSWCTNSNSVNKQNGHSRTSRLASVSSDTNSVVVWNRKDSNTCNSVANENGGNHFLKPTNTKNTNVRKESIEMSAEKI